MQMISCCFTVTGALIMSLWLHFSPACTQSAQVTQCQCDSSDARLPAHAIPIQYLPAAAGVETVPSKTLRNNLTWIIYKSHFTSSLQSLFVKNWSLTFTMSFLVLLPPKSNRLQQCNSQSPQLTHSANTVCTLVFSRPFKDVSCVWVLCFIKCNQREYEAYCTQ